jgi:VWFA-related protein
MKPALTTAGIVILLICVTGASEAVRSQDLPDRSAAEKQRPRYVHEREAPQEPDDVLRVETGLVPVDVTVTDKTGRPVKNLKASNFRLYEDGVERPIAFFNMERRGGDTRPIAVVFALDISGSMSADELGRLRSAMQVFAEGLGDRTSLFAVMAFGMSAKTIQGFTGDRQKLERAFDRLSREANGLSTHTFDAVDDAVRLLVKHAPRTRERQLIRRAVIVVTDGFPVGDTVSPATVIERANAADVTVYTVTLPSFSRMLASTDRAPLPTPLDVSGLTEKTGGTNVYATQRNFDPLFKSIAEEVASTYVVAFYPPEENRRDGKFHTLRVEGPDGLTLRQSRPGYKNNVR